MMNWRLITAIIVTSVLTLSNGQSPSVSLMVEGGADSLIGPQCPGTIKLLCEGTDSTFLQWSFNGNMDIEIFVPDDDSPLNITNTNNPAFLSVALTSLSRSGLRANFSSILTVDLSLLQSENIVDIACAGSTSQEQVHINVTVIPPSIPETPNITEVIVIYSLGMLNSIEIIWNKMNIPCPAYEESLFYEVNITTANPVRIDHTSCPLDEMSCSVMVPIITDVAEYEVFISASNSEGSSQIGMYPQLIDQSSEEYLIMSEVRANFTDCQIQGSCEGLNTTCIVRYTQDPMYNDGFSGNMESSFVFVDLTPETTYYLEFSATVNESLQLRVINRLQIVTECTLNNGGAIAAAVIVPLLIISLLLVVVIILTAVMARNCQERQGGSNSPLTEANGINASTQTDISGDMKSLFQILRENVSSFIREVRLNTGMATPISSTSPTLLLMEEEEVAEHCPAKLKGNPVSANNGKSPNQSLTDTSTQTEKHDRRFPPLELWPKGVKAQVETAAALGDKVPNKAKHSKQEPITATASKQKLLTGNPEELQNVVKRQIPQKHQAQGTIAYNTSQM